MSCNRLLKPSGKPIFFVKQNDTVKNMLTVAYCHAHSALVLYISTCHKHCPFVEVLLDKKCLAETVPYHCRGIQEESEELAQALQALKDARRDAAAHEDAAGDFLEELDEKRAEVAALEQQLADAKVSCMMTAYFAGQPLAYPEYHQACSFSRQWRAQFLGQADCHHRYVQ